MGGLISAVTRDALGRLGSGRPFWVLCLHARPSSLRAVFRGGGFQLDARGGFIQLDTRGGGLWGVHFGGGGVTSGGGSFSGASPASCHRQMRCEVVQEGEVIQAVSFCILHEITGVAVDETSQGLP